MTHATRPAGSSAPELKCHLDIGCGPTPRNPFGHKNLFGVDIRLPTDRSRDHFREADLSTQPIPFGPDQFDSVSAFDFLEHVPRHAIDPISGKSRFPFVELMNEVWRVLRRDGVFYAYTPAYPRAEAFQDPTHVNIITDRTHDYFCGASPAARLYGFEGRFDAIRVVWTCPKNAMDPGDSLRRRLRDLHRRLFRNGITHLLWELRAIK